MYVCMYIYKYIYIHIYIYIYIYIYKLCMSMLNVQIYIKKIRHLLSGVTFRFLPNLRRLSLPKTERAKKTPNF